MSWLALALAVFCFSLLFYLLLRAFNKALSAYEQNFKGLAQRNLAEVFLFFDPMQLWIGAFMLCLSCMLLSYLVTAMLSLSLIVGVIFLLLPPWVMSKIKYYRRLKFEQQLPDMLLSLSGALRAGSGVQNALKHLLPATPTPLSQELSLLIREQRLGLSFEDALENLSRRMPMESTFLVVSSLKIAAQTGGDLAQALERIAASLRTCLQIQGRIKALTSQGKMQAWVMSLLPVLLLFALNYLDPVAMNYLWNSWLGWSVLALIGLLELTGIWMIRKIIAIDV